MSDLYVIQPSELNIKLYDHQLVSIKRMEKMEETRSLIKKDWVKEFKIGINADPTGYGKTLSTIGLLVRDNMEWDTDMPYIENILEMNTNLIKTNTINRYEKIICNLILVSPSIIHQWEKELSYSNLNIICINTKKKLENLELENLDVVLITPSLYNYLIQMYSKYAWKRFIFDEPANIRVPNMKKVQAGFYWFITATPFGIWQKHYKCSNSFIKNIIGEDFFQFKKEFSDLIVKNDIEFINKSFSIPKTLKFKYECFQPILKLVNDFVTPSVKRMLEANDIEGVISLLGGVKTDNIFELLKSNKIKDIKQLKIRKELHILKNQNTLIQKCDKQIIKLENEVVELDKRFSNFKDHNCSICLNKIVNPVLESNCNNIFCSSCLLTWLSKHTSCPICRKTINVQKLIYMTQNQDKNPIPTKEETILKLLQENPDNKFLIFSDYNASFNSINKILKNNKIDFVQLKGNTVTRAKNIKMYKEGKLRVIFLNSKYDGSGINLQETTDIIFYHQMSKRNETQIIGRAQRIGRKNTLKLHYLISNI